MDWSGKFKTSEGTAYEWNGFPDYFCKLINSVVKEPTNKVQKYEDLALLIPDEEIPYKKYETNPGKPESPTTAVMITNEYYSHNLHLSDFKKARTVDINGIIYNTNTNLGEGDIWKLEKYLHDKFGYELYRYYKNDKATNHAMIFTDLGSSKRKKTRMKSKADIRRETITHKPMKTWTNSERASFNKEISRINLNDLVTGLGRPLKGCANVKYEPSVRPNEEVPGLIEFVKEEVANIIKCLRNSNLNPNYSENDICVILSPYRKERTYHSPSRLSDIEDLIVRYEKVGVMAVPTDELKKFLQRVNHTEIINGEYVYRDGEAIVIYYMTLDTRSNYTYAADIRRVLSHEMFHLVHRSRAGRTFDQNTDIANRVKEALADFYSFLYILNPQKNIWGKWVFENSTEKAKDRYNAWIKNLSWGWPYSFARFFMYIEGQDMPYSDNIDDYRDFGCTDKFYSVYDLSISSMKEAYDRLIESDKEERDDKTHISTASTKESSDNRRSTNKTNWNNFEEHVFEFD